LEQFLKPRKSRQIHVGFCLLYEKIFMEIPRQNVKDYMQFLYKRLQEMNCIWERRNETKRTD
jgi:hypothetical protein